MLVDALYGWIGNALNSVVSTLPTCLSIGFDVSGIGSLSPYLAGIGLFVDVGTLSTVLGFIAATELTLRGVRVAVWVYEHLPFVQ